MDKLKVVVTGGNGFLGYNLIIALLKNNFEVIVIEKNNNYLNRLFPILSQIKLYHHDENKWIKIFEEHFIHSIIHCATNYGKNNIFSDIIESNILFPIKLCELGLKHGIKSFINTDTFFNSDNNSNYTYLESYTTSKKQVCEWLKLKSNASQIINMKLEHIYGPNDNIDKFVPMMINRLLSNEFSIDLTAGEQKRDFIFIDDVISAYIFVLKNLSKFNKEYNDLNVGTTNAVSIREFLEKAKEITGSKSILNFGKLPYRDNEIMYSAAKQTLLQENGWKSLFNIEEGLIKTINLNLQ